MNADNYHLYNPENPGCYYRFANTIDVNNIPARDTGGLAWDTDGSLPDVKVNFGRNSKVNYEFTTNISNNGSSVSLSTSNKIQFTNEDWKYEVLDYDLPADSTEIISGIFNPVVMGNTGVIPVTNGSVTLRFHYSTK